MTWDGAFNVRDLGGLPTRDGRRTSYGGFFRSSSPRFMTAAGWQQCADAGVRTVVDLRRADELVHDPRPTCDAARTAGLTVLGVDLDGTKDAPVWQAISESGVDGTPLFLEPFLAAEPERVVAVMTALARAPEGGVMFHCQAGRDRTGIVALVLLCLAGVTPAAVAEDYERSGPLLAPVFALIGRPDEQVHVDAVMAEHRVSATEVLTALADGFDAAAYLRGGGMEAADVDALRRRLLLGRCAR